jgi:hypothetical protein
MSAGRHIVTPMPTASPLMAAITGLVQRNRRSTTMPPVSRMASGSSPRMSSIPP